MPELPDITIYREALESRVRGESLEQVEVRGPFLLRTVETAPGEAEGRRVSEVRRIGKRIAIGMDNGVWLAIHLMIAGRLHWRGGDAKGRASKPSRKDLLALRFSSGTLTLTEAGARHRASLHVLAGEAELKGLDAGGIDVLACGAAEFAEVLRSANHTLKRALTDPHLFSGIGNAYSDEILHSARLSPVALTQRLSSEEVERLHGATRTTLVEWTERLRREAGGEFPERVTAFREGMAVHGRYGKPCPRCGTPVQRIRHGEHETNYCPGCQTKGRLLADRALSRLLRQDWPRTVEEMEARRAPGRAAH